MKIISYAIQSLGAETMIMVACQNESGRIKVYVSTCTNNLQKDIKRTVEWGQRIDNSDLFNINLNNFIKYES